MKIARRKTRSAEVYTSSLNDIMFFLLLFFLIISTMATAPAAIKVLLPNAENSDKVVTKKNISLAITSDLRYFIDDKQIAKHEIESTLQAIVASKGETDDVTILLQADKALALQDVVDLIDIGNKVHVKMVLFTQQANK